MGHHATRTPIVVGNWKMNLKPVGARALASELLPLIATEHSVDVVICPPFIDLPAVAEVVAGSTVGVGAQDAYDVDHGAFTGEVSAAMLRGLATHVILGHSERRVYFHETDAMVNRKLQAAFRHDLTPIVCVGESLDEFEAGQTESVVRRQVGDSMAGLLGDQVEKLVVAYEPVWAIGTGKAATPEIAQYVAALIRSELGQVYGHDRANLVRIQYGGSVTETNCGGFFAQLDVDGALVGGASLKAQDFVGIIRQAALVAPR